MLSDFFVRAMIAGILVAAAAGPFGCFILWRRMAYFGDTLAHASLLGLGLALTFGTNTIAGVFIASLIIASLLIWLEKNSHISTDGLLGILSHGSLAIGLVVISLLPNRNLDAEALLFGDILTTGKTDILYIAIGVALALLGLRLIWSQLLTSTVDEELAKAEGINTQRNKLVFIVLLAAVIAICVKIIGVLLVTSLLIIPAATARRFAPNPELMAVLASVFGVISVIGGLYSSLKFDTLPGPSIVVFAFLAFALSIIASKWVGGKNEQ